MSLAALGACAPKFGDGCHSATDCSANGDRMCDRSQPGGYCTIMNCEPDGCSDEGTCVRFRPDEARLSSSWCMLKCKNTGDCDRDQYVCRSAAQLNNAESDAGTSTGKRLAEVLDSDSDHKFCVVKE